MELYGAVREVLTRAVCRCAGMPQGGGHAATGLRCPHEWITVELMKRAARRLAGGMDYEVPPQDMALDMRRLPTIPQSGSMIRVGRRG